MTEYQRKQVEAVLKRAVTMKEALQIKAKLIKKLNREPRGHAAWANNFISTRHIHN
jgi:hypothetical protein